MRDQAGALHHRQARALGMSERRIATRVRTGAWNEPHPGVYVAAGAPLTHRTRCATALLAVRYAGRDGHRRHVAVARLSAAWLLDLGVPEPARVDLIVPFADAAPTLDGVRVVRASTWPRRAFGVVDGLPVTSVQDTLVDVARLLPRERLHAIVQAAAFQRPSLPLSILRCCRRGRPGSANARRAAALVMAGVDSSLHAEGLALLRAAGLGPVDCGVELVRGAGPTDCVIRGNDGGGLAIEWDGDAHRVDRATFLHDREKDRLLRGSGYVTLRYTSDQVRRRDPVIADVRAALHARSLKSVRPLGA